MPHPAHRVFLSHSGKDKDFVKELYRRLTRDGLGDSAETGTSLERATNAGDNVGR